MYTLFSSYSSTPYDADQCFSTCPVSNDLVGFSAEGIGNWCICHYNDGNLPTGHSAPLEVPENPGTGPVEGSDDDDFVGNCYKYHPAQ